MADRTDLERFRALIDELSKEREARERYEKALRWYAQWRNFGERAREALSATGREQ